MGSSAALGNEIGVRIFAESGELKPGMEGAANDVERAAERMRRSVAGLSDNVATHMSQMSSVTKAANDDAAKSFDNVIGSSSRFGTIVGAAFAAVGGAAVVAAKSAIDSLDRMGEEAERIGMTTVALSQLAHAGKMTGLEFSEMTSAITRLSAKMQDAQSGDKNAVAWFKDLGVSVTDANGKMKSVEQMLEEVADRFAQFDDGAAKTALAVDGFGRSGARLIPLLNQGSAGIREMRQEADDLGATIGDEASAQAAKFNDQLDRIAVRASAAARSIATELLPALNRLSGELVAGLKHSDGLFDAMVKYGLTNPFKDHKERIAELAEEAQALEDKISIGRGSDGDERRLRSLRQQLSYYREIVALSEAVDNPGADSNGRIQGAGKTEVSRTPSGSSGAARKAGAPESRMSGWEATLAEQKAAFILANEMYEMSLAEEKRYWDEKLETLSKGDKEYGAVMKKSADLQLQILKKAAQEGRAIAQENIEEWKRSATFGIELQQKAAEQAFALGQITKEEMLLQEAQFEQERYEIAREAIEQRLELLQKDPNMNPVEYQRLKNQLLEIERKHALDKQKIESQINIEKNTPLTNVFQTIERSFSQSLTGMLTRAMTWRQALGNIFNSLVGTGVQMGTRLLTNWIFTENAKTAATVAGATTRATAENAAAGQSIVMRLGSAIKSILISAWEAMAGAFAAMASIPVVGPVLAVGAGAAAFAAVSGIVGNLPSAEGGWDIPAGASGLMRYHEQEMMLPMEQANTVRSLKSLPSMLAETREALSGGVSGAVAMHMHVNSASPKDMIRSMKDGGALYKALKDLDRRFVRKS